jgi:hypothetical protein
VAAPWEKYGAAAPAGPWTKYAAPVAPLDVTGQPELGWNPPAVGPEGNPPSGPAPNSSFLSDIGETIAPITDAVLGTIRGAPETALTAATAGGSTILGGLKGLLQGKTPDESANIIRDFIQQHTYQPVTPEAQGMTALLGAPSAAIGAGGEKLAEVTGSPLMGAAAAGVGNLALMGAGGKAAMAERGGPTVESVAKPPTSPGIDIGRQAGFKFRPSDVQAAMPGKQVPGTTITERTSGSGLQNDLVLENQSRTTQLAAEDLGVKHAAQLGDAEFNKLKAPEFKVYEQADAALRRVAPSSEFSQLVAQGADAAKLDGAVTTTKVLGALRRKAAKEIQSDVIATQESGYGKRKLADQIEEAFGQQLQAIGDADLLQGYQAARQRLAKINDVETATRAGQVDAGTLFKLQGKGVPLTGRLKIIADTFEAAPEVMKHSLKTARGQPKAEPTVAGVLRDVGSAALRKIPFVKSALDVRSQGFQNKLGAEATPEQQSYFSTYGAPSEISAPRAPESPQLGAGTVPFSPTGGVPPGAAGTLAGDLGVAPDMFSGAEQQFPPAPSRTTAEVPPPVRGDVNFTPSQLEANHLAGDLGLANEPARAPGSIDYTPAADTSLAEGLGVAPPRLREQTKLPVETSQTPALQLTQPGTKISVASDKSGNHTVRAEGGGELTAKSDTARGVLQITGIEVPRAVRRQGRGIEMMKRLIEIGRKRGEKVISGNRVSEPQAALYAELEKQGTKIKRNPATKQASGELVSKSELKPVFEVIGTPATE